MSRIRRAVAISASSVVRNASTHNDEAGEEMLNVPQSQETTAPQKNTTSSAAAVLDTPTTTISPRAATSVSSALPSQRAGSIPPPKAAEDEEDMSSPLIVLHQQNQVSRYGSQVDWRQDYLDLGTGAGELKDWTGYSHREWLRAAWPKVLAFTIVLLVVAVAIIVAICLYMQNV